MADAVGVQTLADNTTHYNIKLTNVSDSTGESAVVKVDVSNMDTTDLRSNESWATVSVEQMWYDCSGMQVNLLWDQTVDSTLAVLGGNGYMDFRGIGGLTPPKGAGYTGDIKLTTINHTADDSYFVVLSCRKKK